MQQMNSINKIRTIYFLSNQVRQASFKFWITTVIKEVITNLEYFGVKVFVIKMIVDALMDSQSIETITKWIVIAIAITAFKELFTSYYNSFIINAESPKIQEFFSNIVMQKCDSIDIRCYDEKEYYDNYVMAVKDIDKKAMKTVEDIGILLGTVILIALTSTYIIILDPILLLFVILPVIGDSILRVKISRKEYKKQEELSKVIRKQDYIKKINNNVEFAEETRLFSLGKLVNHLFLENMQAEEKISDKHFKGLLKLYLQSDALYEPKNLLLIFYLAFKVIITKSISAGDFIAIQTALSAFSSNLGKITQRTSVFNKHALHATRYKSFLEYRNIVKDGPYTLSSIESIEFQNVSFRYSPDTPFVLHGICFKITAGEQLALVGKNGQGKSTIIKLLLRFYDVTEGTIFVNGIPIDQFRIGDLRREILYLSQQFHCYKLSVSDNLMTSNTAEKEYNNQILGLDKDIEALPKGELSLLGTDLYEDGIELSRGQQQRIAICRALNQTGSLIIMDEPTSALDPKAEAKLLNALEKHSTNKVSLLVSHNLSLAKHSTKIIVLENGRIEEMGSHQELIIKNGLYQKMYLSQLNVAWGR